MCIKSIKCDKKKKELIHAYKRERRNTWSKDMKNIGRNVYKCSICDMRCDIIDYSSNFQNMHCIQRIIIEKCIKMLSKVFTKTKIQLMIFTKSNDLLLS